MNLNIRNEGGHINYFQKTFNYKLFQIYQLINSEIRFAIKNY